MSVQHVRDVFGKMEEAVCAGVENGSHPGEIVTMIRQAIYGAGCEIVPRKATRAMIGAAGGDCVDLYRADDPSYEPSDVWDVMISEAVK